MNRQQKRREARDFPKNMKDLDAYLEDLYATWQKRNPQGTLDDFCKDLNDSADIHLKNFNLSTKDIEEYNNLNAKQDSQ